MQAVRDKAMAWLTVTHEVTRGPWTQWTSSGDKEKNSKVSKITVKSTKITKTENIWAWPGSDNMLANLWCSPLTTAPHWAKLLPLHERSTICASLSSLPRDYQRLPGTTMQPCNKLIPNTCLSEPGTTPSNALNAVPKTAYKKTWNPDPEKLKLAEGYWM